MKREFSGGKFVSFLVPKGARDLELYAAMPAGIPVRKGLSLELRVLATSTVRVEAVALVPLADEIPPPPPEPWKPDRSVGGQSAPVNNPP
jgi:hypothetical protein